MFAKTKIRFHEKKSREQKIIKGNKKVRIQKKRKKRTILKKEGKLPTSVHGQNRLEKRGNHILRYIFFCFLSTTTNVWPEADVQCYMGQSPTFRV